MARNLDLEAAIVANPDDRDNYVVYCDWLEAQDDPRAELMRWQLREEEKSAKWQRRMIDKVLPRTEAALLGELATRAKAGGKPNGFDVLEWRRGFIDRLYLHTAIPELPAVLAELLANPSCFALRAVTVFPPRKRGPEEELTAVIDLVAAGAPRTLRSVRLSGDRDAKNVARLGVLPRLEELQAGAWSGPALSGAAVRAIAEAPWRALRVLELGIGSIGATAADLAPLLARTDLELDHLSLTGSHDATNVARALLDSPLAAGADKLTVMFQLEQADYELLFAHRERFAASEFRVWDATWNERFNGR